ncbi:MAG: methanogenesis marker 15 protein [Methanophagales archaeon]|mgnify:FL=1|nr:methanogenesis marker 15 protein [Methanophagales archaeon]MCW3141894.1 methanogenesis marker 15 protein [Methanophagales archaeon]
MTKVAQISCGTEYSGIQWLLNDIAERVGIELVYPEMELSKVELACKEFGFEAESPSLNMMMARAVSMLDDPAIKGALLLTCFKCSEGTIVKDMIRRFLHEKTDIPVILYSNVEKPKEIEIFSRLEALKTLITRKALLMREKQEGITIGVDSGSSTTKAVVMRDNEIAGEGWLPTTDPVKSADDAIESALKEAEIPEKKVDAIGVTGHGRELVSEHVKADLSLEEVSVVSKGAALLSKRHKGDATVIDIGGMNNKLILMRNGIANTFNLGGICGGSSGRFLEVAAHRLDVHISELGQLAMKSKVKKGEEEFELQSYCMVFGIQSLVVALASGVKREDVAAAACRSVAEQVYENQIREMEIRPPVIFVGGVSLVEGVKREFEDMLGVDIIVPPYSQHAGAVGIATLVSGV